MSRTSPRTEIHILLVEDSPDDADLMVEALNEGALRARVTHVEDGEQAIRYLRAEGDDAAPRPDLVLLDLFLPRMNGHEVLAAIKHDPALRRIPVVILTATDNDRAILGAYDLHANCCVPKPADQAEFAQVVERIEHFWLAVASRA